LPVNKKGQNVLVMWLYFVSTTRSKLDAHWLMKSSWSRPFHDQGHRLQRSGCFTKAINLSYLIWNNSLLQVLHFLHMSWGHGPAFSVCGPSIWNRIPPRIRNLHSAPAFRKALKTYWFSEII